MFRRCPPRREEAAGEFPRKDPEEGVLISEPVNDWHVYILRCGDGTLYTGITTDVERRLEEHRSQGSRCAKYLRGKTPLELVFRESAGSRSRALKTEHALRSRTKQEKERVIDGTIDLKHLIETG